MLTLRFFPVNSAWAFLWGNDLRTARPTHIGQSYPMFFVSRAEAVEAARLCRLKVSRSGKVEVAE